MIESEKTIYSLTNEDVQTVAEQELDRLLSVEEIALLEEQIAKNISWYDAIREAIEELIVPSTSL